jgi:integrase
MASAYEKNGKLYLRYKDARGKWRGKASTARTKTEAKRLANDLERAAERQRLGLEPMAPVGGGGTLRELLTWWLGEYVARLPSSRTVTSVVNLNLVNTKLSALRLIELTPGEIEKHLQSLADRLGPSSLNHLRAYLSTAFGKAKRAGRWNGPNPAFEVERRKVPKRLPDFLKTEEVPRVLAVLSDAHRPLFAAAIYTGLRKGELAGLRKADVDFGAGLVSVCRSYERDTTKGKRAAAIPIATELVPYLETAIRRSKVDLVFPGHDGEMMSENAPLEEVLRRALGRARIVEHYLHVCRKKGCTHQERATDDHERRCPTHRYRLWPKAVVRKIRFHDLRHTTASLLMMSGANPAAVQRILRHSDPKITTEIYGHLLPGYLRSEIDRLRFAPDSKDSQSVASGSKPLATRLLPDAGSTPRTPRRGSRRQQRIRGNQAARPEGFEPPTSGLEIHRSIQLSYGRGR